MKTFKVAGRAEASPGGEHVLGAGETGSHACYMVYGRLNPGEGGRVLNPGHGHEELVMAVKGDLVLTGHVSGILREGEAVHLSGDASCVAENPSLTHEAVYVAAGGHSSYGHSH